MLFNASAADQTGHLLWRLRNGHTPAAAKAPKAAVILIGTNDLGHASEAGVADIPSFAPNALVRRCLRHLLLYPCNAPQRSAPC